MTGGVAAFGFIGFVFGPVLLVLATYLWDALGLWFLFADQDQPLSYRAVLLARGRSYFFTAFNFTCHLHCISLNI